MTRQDAAVALAEALDEHAAARAASRRSPHDMRALRARVCAARAALAAQDRYGAAWREYRRAAAAGLADEISRIVPAAFRDDPGSSLPRE